MKIRYLAVVCLFVLAGRVTTAQDSGSSEKFDIFLPNLPWALEVDGTGYTVRTNEIKPDGRRYFLAENPKTHVLVSVFLEASKGATQSDECKRSLEEKRKRNSSLSTGPVKGVVFRESGEMQILEYMLAEVDGVPANQKNVFACIPKEDAFVDIHISKIMFKETDWPPFDALLQSLHFVLRAPSGPPTAGGKSWKLFQEGSRYFLAQQYDQAIGPYQQSLDMEKSGSTFSKNYWRVLIDNLSMAYGITGDLAKSKATLDYGVSKDPEYPMFYYNLACVAAEKGDIKETEKMLKSGYDKRSNMIQGETYPDARKDDSFQKLLTQSEFREFANSLYGAR